jgi:hypothetical protein
MRLVTPRVPALLFLLVAGGVILSGIIPHRVAYDQLLYHQQAIELFARQWPTPDLSDYLSATTPGFHLVLALLERELSIGVRGMQVVCALITFALVWWLGSVARVSLRPWHAAAAVLPVAASMYVFASGAWVLPDNLAWLGVLAMVLLALSPRVGVRELALGGVVLAALVCTRQVHAWTGGLLFAAAWLSRREGPEIRTGASMPTGLLGDIKTVLLSDLGRRCVLGGLAVLACLPAALVLVHFYGVWGGLVPPTFQYQYHTANAAGPAFVLAVFGFVACFNAGWVGPRVVEAWRQRPVWVMVFVLAGLALAAAPVTTAGTNADYFAGRRSGLWDIAAKLPMVAGHSSVMMVGLAMLGALSLGAYVCLWKARPAIIVTCAFVGYGLAMAAGGELWQRYAEPFVLIMMVVVLGLDGPNRATARAREPGRLERLAPLGACVLALLFVALNVRDLRKPGTQLVTDSPPPSVTPSEQFPVPRRDSPWDRYMMRTPEWRKSSL